MRNPDLEGTGMHKAGIFVRVQPKFGAGLGVSIINDL